MQLTYSDGHRSHLFKTQIQVDKEFSLTYDMIQKVRFTQAFGVKPRDAPGYITRLLVLDSKQATLEDWKPDFVQTGDDRHAAGNRLEISQNEEIVGVFGCKQDATDTIFELGFVMRPKQGVNKSQSSGRPNKRDASSGNVMAAAGEEGAASSNQETTSVQADI